MRELTGGEGVAAVYDGVGKDTFDESLLSLRVRGTLALYGASSGAVDPVDPRRLMTRRVADPDPARRCRTSRARARSCSLARARC